METSGWLLAALVLIGLLVGAVGAVLLYAWWLRRRSAARLMVPASWPLAARNVVNDEEREVLRWLYVTFHDHLVLVKVSVLRFTAPKRGESDEDGRWQSLLNSVYCTFTIATRDGKVVGCLDVSGKRTVSRAKRELKESLLADCGIGYVVLSSRELPKASAVRAAFLGEVEAGDTWQDQETRGGDSSFHADLDAFNQEKKRAAKEAALKELHKMAPAVPSQTRRAPGGFNADGTGAFDPNRSGRFRGQFEDSFTQHR
ncbi:MAG: DUF2726 domain-containing protein [Comamonadaceae bacterium]|nr:MAG: DUF2726 domain-containing protein [Comamonadaceae bacterium]